MKKLIFILYCFLPVFCFSQQYSEVVQMEGKTAQQLYTTAREWFAKTFVSANDVIQMEDPTSGKIIGKGSNHVVESYIVGKGITAIFTTIDWYPNYTLKIEVKDGRYKYELTDIKIKSSSAAGTTEIPFADYIAKTDEYKNGSDPEWLMANPSPEFKDFKMNKSTARIFAQTNEATYKLIQSTNRSIDNLIDDLKTNMTKADNSNW
ncbi:MAG TPA: DUF4468 domain-containing protein [Bacteroidales bacterium]|nr:DUF4468 domain-containing protein [Bacteroidales bacterium]